MNRWNYRSTATLVAVLLGLLLSAGARAQLLRQKAFGTAAGDEALGAMTPIRAGGYLLAGTQQVGMNPDHLYLLRLNAVGDTLWTRRYNIPGTYVLYLNHALEDAAGRVLLVGRSATYSGTSQQDAYLMLLSPQGDTLWTRRTQSPFKDQYLQPQLTSAGDFLLAGNLAGVPQLLRIAPSGQVVQQVVVSYAGPDIGQVTLLLPAAAGGYWIGAINSTPPFLAKFIRFDAAGTQGVDIPIPANFPVLAPSVPVPRVYDFFYSGNDYFLATGDDITRVDANLNVLWSRARTALGYAFNSSHIQATPDGNFVVAGEIYTSPGSNTDLGFAKISPSGQTLRDTALFRPGNEYLAGLAVAPGTGNYVFAGYGTPGPIGREDIFWGELGGRTVTAARGGLAVGPTLTAYPNPLAADGRLHLRAGRPLRGTLCLTDVLGRDLRTWPAGGALTQDLDLPSLPAGVYLLTHTDEQGQRHSLRLVQP